MESFEGLNYGTISNNVTYGTLKGIIDPFAEHISALNSMDELGTWIGETLPEDIAQHFYNELASYNDSGDVEGGKHATVQLLIDWVLSDQPESVTPWSLFKRNELQEAVFGPSLNTLPVIVVVGPSTFTHELSEELARGLLFGLGGSEDVRVYVFNEDYPLDVNEFLTANLVDGLPIYSATVNGVQTYFNTEEFIRGVNTGAKWTGVNPANITENFGLYNPETGELSELSIRY